MKIKKIFSRIMAVMLAVVMALSCLPARTVQAASVYTIPDAKFTAVSKMTAVQMHRNNIETWQWNDSMAGKYSTFRSDSGNRSFAVKANTISGAKYNFSYDNPLLTINFKNVMYVNGKAVNAQIRVTNIEIRQNYTSGVMGNNYDMYVSFMEIGGATWIGSGSGYDNDDYVTKIVTFDTLFTWADGTDAGKNILSTIPMHQGVADVDTWKPYESQYSDRVNEGWDGVAGYTGDMYVFESTGLNCTANPLQIRLERDLNTTGDDEWKVSGALCPISQGAGYVSQRFYEYACATCLTFYSPLDDNNIKQPSKSADNTGYYGEKIYDNGDDITWSITQQLHTWGGDLFSTYSDFTFVDTLPDEVTYKSAKLYHGDDDVTASYGTLSYDEAARTVTYELNEATLSNTDLYDGGDLTLKIVTTAVNDGDSIIEVTNNAKTVTNGVSQTCSKTVKVNYDIVLTIKKVWDDDNDRDGIRQESVEFNLMRDLSINGTAMSSATVTVDTVTLSEDNNWTKDVTVRNPIAQLSAYKYTYRWEETDVDGYTSSQETDGSVTTVTNKYTPETTSAAAKKVWNDNDNQDGIRPDSVVVTLTADGDDVQDYTLSADNNWTVTVNDLYKYSDGTEIRYAWTEKDVEEGYAASYNTAGTMTTITNTHEKDKISVSVTKKWEDGSNQDGIRPDEVKVVLKADGVEKGTYTLSDDNNWSASELVDKNTDGKEITYTWEEEAVEGYTSSQVTEGTVTTITNMHEPEKVSLKLVKEWNDNDNQDGIRPDSITVYLTADSFAPPQGYMLGAENDWTVTVNDLDKYYNGKEIQYKWTEEVPDGYTVSYSTEGNTTVITNTHTPEKVSVSVTKKWEDKNDADGIRPDAVKVILKADGTDAGEYSITEADNWTLTVDNLDKYAAGKEITYTWEEEAVEGYTSSQVTEGNATTITNSHMPKYKITTEIDNGTITDTETDIPYGDSRTVTWKPKEGYYIDSVTVDGKETGVDGSYTFDNITADHEVVVKTLPYHTVTTAIDNNGIITDNITEIKMNEDRTVSWTPESGYYVSKVTVDGRNEYTGVRTSGYPTSYEFTDITEDHAIAVETKLIPNLVITKTSDKESYNCDDTVIYTITAAQTVAGAVAENVVISDKDVTKGLEFDLTTVTCSNKDAVIETSDNSFTVSLDELAYGETLTITVKGTVNKDTLESSDIKNTATIISDQTDKQTDDADVTINYNIVTSAVNGTITDSVSDLKTGDNKTINYSPDDGYYLTSVTIDGKSVDTNTYEKSYEFKNIKDNHLIEVVYEPYHKIMTDINNGTITPDDTAIRSGEDRTVTWEPEEGYYVTAVTIDDVVVYSGTSVTGYPTEHTFSEIQGDHEVIVKTALIPNLVITKTSDKAEYDSGDVILYTITVKQTVEGAEATNVLIEDKDFTEGLEFDLTTVSCSMDDAVITTNEDGTFTVKVPELKDEVVITVKGTVNTETLKQSDITNKATVVSDQTEEVSSETTGKVTYTITTSVVNGTISENIMNIPFGESRTITYSPNEGYSIASVTVNGVSVDVTDNEFSYTFEGISSNNEIEVVYEKIPEEETTSQEETTTEETTVSEPETTTSVSPAANTSMTSPKTGYKTPLFMILVMLLLSLCTGMFAYAKSRKQEKTE